ncbi:MAG: hypothetical protein IJX62_01870, partial [Clostridia bacterium]|nr:hypothetical protein [Clostridia bacterium]
MKERKLITRVLLLLLALVTVFTMAACNQGDGEQKEPTGNGTTQGTQNGSNGTGSQPTGDTTTDPADEGPVLPDKDYSGTEFKILSRNCQEYLNDLYIEEQSDPTSVERALYARLVNITDAYGVVFSMDKREPYNEMPQLTSNVSKTGTDVYDVVIQHAQRSVDMMTNNSLYNLKDLPYNDFSAEWWNQDAVNELSTTHGNLYLTTGDISYMSVGAAFVMFFNKDIVESVPELDMPYQAVYDDEWTFEVFETYVTTLYSNMNGSKTDDIATGSFGYATWIWNGPQQMLYTTGEKTLRVRDDKRQVGLTSSNVNWAAENYRELVKTSGTAYFESNKASDEALTNAFISGRVAFYDANLVDASLFKGTELNFGVLPWPKYDDDVEGFHSALDAGCNLYSVLRNTTDANAERISIILEALAYDGYKNVMPLYFDTILSYQYLKDEESVDMLHIIRDS